MHTSSIIMPIISQIFQRHSHDGDSPSPSKDKGPAQPQRRPTLTRYQSNPNLRAGRTRTRPPGFNSIKELARRTSRATLSTAKARLSIGSDKESVKSSGAVKPYLECTPPEPTKLEESTNSSLESSSPDRSGYSTALSSLPTTPAGEGSSLKASEAHEAPVERSTTEQDMGQKSSTVVRRKAVVHRVESLNEFSTSPPPSPGSEDESSPVKRSPVPIFAHRPNTIQVAIPRRRSSLTVIRLDSSHFDKPIDDQPILEHRSNSLSNNFQHDTGSQSTIVPAENTLRQDNLSPSIQSPRSSFRQPSVQSQRISSRDGTPQIPVHFPKTYPNGPIETPQPPLKGIHFNCYTHHRRMLTSPNKIHPVPCMTCGVVEGEIYWTCVWCYLRVCGQCKAEFSARGRNLDALLDWIQRLSRPSPKKDKVLR